MKFLVTRVASGQIQAFQLLAVVAVDDQVWIVTCNVLDGEILVFIRAAIFFDKLFDVRISVELSPRTRFYDSVVCKEETPNL